MYLQLMDIGKVKGDDENVEHNGDTVGFRETFQFYRGKPGSSSKTSWLMHEFRVIDHLPSVEGQKKLENWVLCEIWNKERGWYYENKFIIIFFPKKVLQLEEEETD
ncbi:unnamed protein product [Fraxinus pennsylvanica]|uniref:NAC domain-containing protein n=1 Tax=Fraxinus pennsylvanica TaxID=56036 RepID=A0AAD2DVI1_9LAMI|nr:unnamed protein product [Fraxinus pennsylvanica]